MMDLAILERCLATGVSPIHVSTDTAARKQIAVAYFADLNQSIGRKPWTVGKVQAFTGGTTLYSFALDRVLGAAEMLWIYGRSLPEDITCSEGELRDLVGNCQTAQTMSRRLALAGVYVYMILCVCACVCVCVRVCVCVCLCLCVLCVVC